MSLKILDARFVATAVKPDGYPKSMLDEIAFVGRSNVGKSSMINTLVQRRKLVRVSNTPGRTKTLNFFDVDLELGTRKYEVRLADLPGYGFAKVSKSERESWKTMITQYLEKRQKLQVVVQIIDAEVGPTSDDFNTLDYLQEHARRILVAATKIDKISKAQRKPRVKQLAAELNLPPEAVLMFSATEKLGVEETWAALLSTIDR